MGTFRRSGTDRAPGRWSASEVTCALWVRILLSALLLVPAWLVARFVVGFVGSGDGTYAGEPLVDVPLAAVGALLLMGAVRYLRDVWQVNPLRRGHDRDQDRAAKTIADAWGKRLGASAPEPPLGTREPPS